MTNRLMIHTVEGGGYGFGAFLARIAESGAFFRGVKCVGDFGRASEVLALFPDALTVGRVRSLDDVFDPKADVASQAAAWYKTARAKWLLDPQIQVWEVLNEQSPGTDVAGWNAQAEFYLRLMDLAEADGYTLGLWNCSTGTPPYPGTPDNNPAAYQAIARTCRRALSGGHILCLHEYGLPSMPSSTPHHTLRYRALLSYLRQEQANCDILISECAPAAGYDYAGSAASYLNQLEWYDAELTEPELIGACIFTLGAGEWKDSDFSPMLPDLAEYIIAQQEPPDPPAPPRGKPRIDYARTVRVAPEDDPALNESATYQLELTGNEARAVAIFLQGWREGRKTTGGSYDDAGIGDLKIRNAELFDIAVAEESVFSDWYEKWYAGATVTFLKAPQLQKVDAPQPPPPPVEKLPAYIGLHMAARGGRWITGDWDCIRLARPEALKVMSNHSFEDLDLLVAQGHGFGNDVLRLFAPVATDPEMTAAKFYNVHGAWFNKWRDLGGRYVEIHNEPNSAVEGLGKAWAWNDAAGFAAYYTSVAQRIRQSHPTLLLGYPGLAPSDNVAQWLPSIQPLINAGLVDWIAAHSYWTRLDQMEDEEHGNYYRRFLGFKRPDGSSVPVGITEFSEKNAATPRSEKGRQYVMRYADWKARGELLFAFAFCSSSPEAAFQALGEPWCLPNGQASEIPGIVGAR